MSKFGIIGTGRFGQLYETTIKTCDHSVLWTANSRNLPTDKQISECDGVVIATTPSTHQQYVERCIDLNVPCIVEKPLTLDLKSAKEVDTKIKRTNAKVLVNHNPIFDVRHELLERTIKLRNETVQFLFSECGSLGPFRNDTNPRWDWLPHDIALALHLFGSPSNVQALNVHDLTTVRMDFGTRTALIHSGPMMGIRRRTRTLYTEKHVYVVDMDDPIFYRDWNFDRYDTKMNTIQSVLSLPLAEQGVTSMENLIRYFVNGIHGGDVSRFGTDLAVRVVDVLEQIDGLCKIC